jgi:ribose 5-phosphate isomerase B
VRISVAADELTGVAEAIAAELERRGHEVMRHGALADDEPDDWAWASEAAARDVAEGRAEQAIVCCWTGTGASIAANKIDGIRAALCADAPTAAGARRWNDANVLALSLRATSQAQLAEVLDAWFDATPSAEASDRANVEHLRTLAAGAARRGVQPQLSVRRGRAAVDFYTQALGAVQLYRVGGTTEHEELVCQLAIGDSCFWVADESPAHGNHSPESLAGSTTRMLLVVVDPDAAVAKAVAAGAREVRAVADEHGWRLGRIEDPFGHHWEIGRPPPDWPPRRDARHS